MPGKAHVPDLFERLVRGQRAGTSRTAGGFARGASPQMVRDRMAASLRGSGQLSTAARASMIDAFEIVDDTESSFTLTYAPLFDSWNVSLGWPLENVTDYAIVGRTLTIGDPVDIFRGVADNGPRILQVQYDYLAGVPTAPPGTAALTGNIATAKGAPSQVATFPTPPAAGSTVLLALSASFHGAHSFSGLGATWSRLATIDTNNCEIWAGVGCNGTDDAITGTGGGTLVMIAVELTNVTIAGVQTVTGTAATIGSLTAPSAGGIAFSTLATAGGEDPVTELPSSWTIVGAGVDAGTDVGVIELGGGDSASRVMTGGGNWCMVLVESA